MNISLLPNFSFKPDNEELAYKHAPLYSGKNPKVAFILNHAFYLLAFFIPLFFMLFVMKTFGYAPFGEKCMFVMDGAYINLPVLNGMIHNMQEGTFHLFTLKGSLGSEFYSSIAYYLTSPFTLICLFFDQKTAVILLSLFSVLRIALSGPIFFYYLTHRKIGHAGSPYDPMMLVLSLGYSLSSYALVQYNDFMFLDHFMLFPLLLLFLEQFMVTGTWKKLAFLNAFLLFSNFYLGLILDLFLILYYFFRNTNPVTTIVHRFFKLLLTFFFSFGLSAITVIPGMCSFIEHCHTAFTSLNADHLLGDYYAFFLKHLFNSNPSFYDFGFSGVNLYFGLFAMLLAVLYFFDKKQSLSIKIRSGIFIAILIFSFCTKQFSYLFHLFAENDTSFCCFSFVYIAFLLILGCDVLPNIRALSIWRLLLSAALPAGAALLCMNLVAAKPNYNSVLFSLAIMLVYTIFLLLYRIGSIKRDTFFALTLCVACLELLANAYQISFSLHKENTNMKDVIITNSETHDSEDEFSRAESFDAAEYAYQYNMTSRFSFNRMLRTPQNYSGYTPLEDSLDGIRYLYTMAGAEFSAINENQYAKINSTTSHEIYENQTAFPSSYAISGHIDNAMVATSTFIDEQNSIAKLLGSETPIYTETTPDNVYITLPEETKLSAWDMGNHVFSIKNQSDTTIPSTAYPTLHFTPKESGSLYLILHGNPIHFGTVIAGKEYSYEFSLELSQIYNTVIWAQFCYYNPDTHLSLRDTLRDNACQITYAGTKSIRIQADTKEDSTILTHLPYDKRFNLSDQSSDNISLFAFHDKLAIHVPAGSHELTLKYTYYPFFIGCMLTLFTALVYSLLTLCVKVKKPVLHAVQRGTSLCITWLDKCVFFVTENQIYFLAFLIPFGCYLSIMIFKACEPFGPFSVFNGDANSLALPALHRISDMLREGVPAHSWYGGGGYNLATFLQISPLDLIYTFVAPEHLSSFTTMFVVVMMCLTGPSIVYYLTHRLSGKRAYKKDFRLLIPAMCYSLCNYALLSINNISWYYTLILFPLILLGMEYLMIKKKSRYYIIALGVSLLLQYYLTMFVCFFLVIHFFTYHFDSIGDFIKKGIRFALSSLFTGFLSFYSLYYGLFGFMGNTYAEEDSVFPTSYLFNGFEYLFNRQSIFAEGYTISWSEGNANLYFGIFILLLLVIYILLKEISWREKLRFVIPYAIFFVSLNYSVLNYIFNGMHYQHGVPNRFVFLLVVLASFMSYDCIRLLHKIPRKKILLATLGLVALFTVSYLITESATRNRTAYIATLICLLVYVIALCRPFRRKFTAKLYNKLFVALFCLELFANACYQIPVHIGSTYYVTYLDTALDSVNRYQDMENSLDHLTVYSPLNDNYPITSKVKANTIFSTSLTAQQLNIGEYLGCYTTSNAVVSLNTQTPFGYALGNSRYLLLDMIAYAANNRDVKYYNPIALYDSTIVYENERCFPFAYYLPESFSELMDEKFTQQHMWNRFTQLALDTEEIVLYGEVIKNCARMDESEYPDSNYYTIIYKENYEKEKCDYDMHATVPKTGSVYVKMDDYQYVGDYKEGEKIDFVIDGRSLLFDDETADAEMYVFNNELLTSLSEKINEHPFTVTSFSEDSVYGTIEMPENGYINFTMPYDPRWHILIDGQETEAQSLGNGFLTLYAEKGTHEISMEYVDQRRTPVVTITILFWIGMFAVCFLKDKKKSERENPT